MFNLFFSSDDGWEIRISKCAVLTHNWPSNKFFANGLNFKATKGQINDQDSVQVYKILENLKIGDSTKFVSNELNNLFLFDEKIEDFLFLQGILPFRILMNQ